MAKPKTLEIISILLFAPVYLGVMAAGVALLGEAVFWLQYGAWPGWTLATEFGGYPASSGLLGFDKIVHWYFDLRMSLAILVTALTWLGGASLIAIAD